MKRALADCATHVADPGRMRVTTDDLLSPARLSRLAQGIRAGRAAAPGGQPPADHGTVYLSVGDAEGCMVSLIQSNYLGFGSGIVIPGTGITMQNRGRGFSLDPTHPNAVQGGVRPFHTIMPGFVTTNGKPFMSFGVMGGHMQPQGHLQLAVRTLFYGQNPQAASDAPRFRVTETSDLALEPGFSPAVARELESRGHRVIQEKNSLEFGGAQAVACIPDGYCAASDHRKDGQAAGV
jgi:gamma-glutamyltranspeptidase/glutathione hydrolase